MLIDKLRARLRPGMESNALALMLSTAATGLLGLVYWAVAERFFPTASIGRASAVISSATMLASLSCLSLGGAYLRFLPMAGRDSTRYVVGGLALTATVGLALGGGFLLVNPANDRLFSSGVEYAVFPLMVAALTLSALTDQILTGLRLAPAVAAKNIAHSVLKILPVVLLGGTASALAMSGSWVLIAFAVTAFALAHAFRRGLRGREHTPPTLPPMRELWSYQSTFLAMTIVVTVTPMVLPLIVVSSLGPEQNAYFNIAWTLCMAVGMLRSGVGSSFVVEASAPDADRSALLRRMTRMLAAVTAASMAGLLVGGPLILRLVGPAYAAEATPLVLVMAGESAVAALVIVYFLLAQLLRRLRLMLYIQCQTVVLTVAGAWVLVPQVGLVGVGLASLGAQLAAAVVIAVPLARAVREMRWPRRAASVPSIETPVA